MPDYAERFGDLWGHQTALPLAHVVTSNDLLRDHDQGMGLLPGQQIKTSGDFLAKAVVWAGQAPAEPPHAEL